MYITTELCQQSRQLWTKGFTICSRSTELLTDRWSAAQHRKQRQQSAPPPSAGWRGLIGYTWGHRSQAHTWNTTDSQDYTWWLKAADTHTRAHTVEHTCSGAHWCPPAACTVPCSGRSCQTCCHSSAWTVWPHEGALLPALKHNRSAEGNCSIFTEWPSAGPLDESTFAQYPQTSTRGYVMLPLQLHKCLTDVKLITVTHCFLQFRYTQTSAISSIDL